MHSSADISACPQREKINGDSFLDRLRDLGRWGRWGIRRLQMGSGALLESATMSLTLNPLAGAAFAWIGYWLPLIVLRDLAWDRWVALDQAAFAAVYGAPFALERRLPVVDLWRTLIADSDPRFRRWVEPCLWGEAAGRPLERALKGQAQAIRHAELTVLADILATERAHGGTAPVMRQLLQLWGQRIEDDADRLGSIGGYIWIGRVTWLAGAVLFWGLVLGSPAIRLHMHSPLGSLITGLTAVALAVALSLYGRQNRQAAQF